MEKKTYDAAFKKEVIRLVGEQGEKAATMARKLGVTNKTMYRWIGEYLQDGEQAFPGKGHLKLDDAELRSETIGKISERESRYIYLQGAKVCVSLLKALDVI